MRKLNKIKKSEKRINRFLKVKFMVLAVALVVISGGSVLMAWTEDIANGIEYTFNKVGIGTDVPSESLEIENGNIKVQNGSISAFRDDNGIDRGLCLDASLSKDKGLITTSNRETGFSVRLGSDTSGTVFSIDPTGEIDVDGITKILSKTSFTNSILEVLGDDDGTYRGLRLEYSRSMNQGLISTPNTSTGFAIRIGPQTAGMAMKIDTNKNTEFFGDLKVTGIINSSSTITAANYSCSSDERYKKNINPLEGALQKIKALNGVSYNWKKEEFKNKGFNDKTDIGFLAQNVETVLPELVYTDKKGYKSVNYQKVTAVLVEAVKELDNQYGNKITALEKENTQLKERLASLEKVNDRIAALEKALEQKSLVSMK